MLAQHERQRAEAGAATAASAAEAAGQAPAPAAAYDTPGDAVVPFYMRCSYASSRLQAPDAALGPATPAKAGRQPGQPPAQGSAGDEDAAFLHIPAGQVQTSTLLELLPGHGRNAAGLQHPSSALPSPVSTRSLPCLS